MRRVERGIGGGWRGVDMPWQFLGLGSHFRKGWIWNISVGMLWEMNREKEDL